VARMRTGRKGSKHYSSEEWVDFVMHQAQQSQMSAMKRHLDAGCKRCSDMANVWSRVAQVASRELSPEPPASAVQHVRQAFSVSAESRQAVIPRLAFDSLWQPVLAGIRSGSPGTSRHVIYAAGRLSIDMRLEPEPRSERINLAGQISIRSEHERSFPPIPVVVSSKTGSLATTTTNSFGEFHLAFVPEQGLQISFAMPDQDEVVIPLDSSGIRST
jgi:hypothetical protein